MKFPANPLLSLLPALALLACQPVQVNRPSPSPSASVQPSASPVPQPFPSTSPSPETSPSPGVCDTTSATVSFVVYENSRDLDLYYPAMDLDLSAPLTGTTVLYGGRSKTNPTHHFSVPRSQVGNQLEIRREGYMPAGWFTSQPLCATMYAGLSALSAEERQGEPVPMDSEDLFSVRELPPMLQYDKTTGFSYALLKDTAAAEPFLTWLTQQGGSDKARDLITRSLAGGKMVVLFSNNSQQMGDIYSVLSTAHESPDALILASHFSGMVQNPRPMGPVGDIFNKRLEIKALARTDKPVIFHAKQPGVGSAKARLEVK